MRSFSRVIQSRYDLEDLGEAALDELLAATGTEAGVLFVVREAALEPLATHGLRESSDLSDNDHVRRALKTDTTVRLSVADPSFVVDSLLVGQPAREVLVGPISFKGVPLGVVVLATATELKADAEHLLEGFRADLGLAVNNALAHDRLERLAAVDPLTDAYNRRFGLARLREEYSRAVRAESPLGVLMLDIDHFKAVNDTYGHLVGDRVLRAVAAACRQVVREGDVLIRYGGEEFMALLPGAGPADVRQVGERIRRAVAETTILEGDQQITVTVSLGGTIYRDATTESPTVSWLPRTPRCTRRRPPEGTDWSWRSRPGRRARRRLGRRSGEAFDPFDGDLRPRHPGDLCRHCSRTLPVGRVGQEGHDRGADRFGAERVQASTVAIPAATQRSPLSGWSAPSGTINIGMPTAAAASIVPDPPWKATTSVAGSSSDIGTYSRTSTPGRAWPNVDGGPPSATTTSAPASAAPSAIWRRTPTCPALTSKGRRHARSPVTGRERVGPAVAGGDRRRSAGARSGPASARQGFEGRRAGS